MIEIWKDVIGFEGYYKVSNKGNVKSVDRKVQHNYGGIAIKKGQLLKNISDKDGYHKVNLKIKQKGYSSIVHRLEAIAFIPNPENKPHVNHKDGIKWNNELDNLEWSTESENRQHAYDMGLQNSNTRQGEKNNFNKLTSIEVKEIRDLFFNTTKKQTTHKSISLLYNITSGCVQSIVSGKSWKQLI